ncbi:MAG: G8 domain-containing protein [Pseudomonadota bacterium]
MDKTHHNTGAADHDAAGGHGSMNAGGMPVIQDNNAFLMAMGAGSRVEIHAADAAKDSWTQLDRSVTEGERSLRLAEATGWEVGDKIAIASTGFQMEEAEERTIVAVSADGRTVTLDRPLENDHYGEIDTYTNGLTGQDRETWDVDMRAEVALLSRNVTIQGDADSADDGYGGHTMIMMGAEMHIDGAELTRMGQAGELGRYPLHWHMLGDASGQYVTNSSIHQTFNKGMTIHGTQNAWIENNAIYDTVGHTYYFEDGSEFGNVLTGNLGMNTRETDSVAAGPIGSDHTATSTYWVTNPNNHLIDNHAAGSDHAGFWILSQEQVEGLSAMVARYDGYVPNDQAPGQWIGNSSHSNGRDGIFIGGQFIEETGQRTDFDPAMGELYQITDFTTYKNQDFGLWVRNGDGVWDDIKVADSKKGARFWGANEVSDSVIIGRSDNAESFGPDFYHGWELYDMASVLQDVHFAGFSEELDTAIANHSGFGRNTNNSVSGLTFEDVAQRFATKVYSAYLDGERDNGGSLMGGLHDLDGSLTGTPGAIITPGILDVLPNENADILRSAFNGIEAAGFNWTEGAVWVEDGNYWVNPASSVIGKVNFVTSGEADERVDFLITRQDNGARLIYSNEAQGRNNQAQLVVDGSGDVEYVVEYPDGIPPTRLILHVQDLPQGATAYYRFKDLPDSTILQGADQVAGRTALDNAVGSAWLRAGNGDIVVKMYADKFKTRHSDAIDDLPRVGDDVYEDRVFLVFEPGPGDQPYGDGLAVPAPADFRPDPNPDPAPDRAESTSATVEDTDDLPRWSDAALWDGNPPGANDVVLIGPGQQVVLDVSTQVRGIIIQGEDAALIVEDDAGKTIDLTADWVLVNNGGLFQAGTESDPIDTDFTLTLTGDDKNFDLFVEAYVAGDMPNTVVASSPPDETRTRTIEDTDNTRAWEFYTDTFDADGVRVSRTMTYDDGRVMETDYAAGIRSEATMTDIADVHGWSSYSNTYDQNGTLLTRSQTNDDGRLVETTYDQGKRASVTTIDQVDSFIWQQTDQRFEGGRLVSSTITYDDGRVFEIELSNGARTGTLMTDAADAYDWASYSETFDPTGARLSRTTIFDDGTQRTTDYDLI